MAFFKVCQIKHNFLPNVRSNIILKHRLLQSNLPAKEMPELNVSKKALLKCKEIVVNCKWFEQHLRWRLRVQWRLWWRWSFKRKLPFCKLLLAITFSFFLSYVLKACAKQLLNRDLISQRWLMLLQSKMCEKTDWELWLSIAKIKTRFLKTRPLFVYFRSFHKNISMKSSLAAVKGKRFHECAVYLFLV